MAGEVLHTKQEFEAETASMGVTLVNYHFDNRVFTSSLFQNELANICWAHSAVASFCGETCTFDSINFSYKTATVSKFKAKKGQLP